jgi:hypothetical protein
MALCQRYYRSIGDRTSSHTNYLYNAAAQDATDATSGFYPFPIHMRAGPTIETTGTAADYRIYSNNSTTVCASVPALSGATTEGCVLSIAVGSGMTPGEVVHVQGNSDPAFIAFTAEL